jgi:hypothetical protein
MTKEETIKIECVTAETLPLNSLHEFQGNLKRLSNDNYKKLKGNILKLGFSFAFHIWRDGSSNFILDGHMRKQALVRMRGEGFTIPNLPIVVVNASSYEEAKQKVLAGTSQYGEMTDESLLEFIRDANLNVQEILDNFDFPTVDIDKILKSIRPIDDVDQRLPVDPDDAQDAENKENPSGSKSYLVHVCPKCSHEFTSVDSKKS